MSNSETLTYVEQLQAIQEDIRKELTTLERSTLLLQTDNARWNTVRRVVLRFGDHLREHTTQLIAAREDIGDRQTMPQRMLAQAEESYGRLMGSLIGLDDESLDRAPEPGEWSPRQILEHMVQVQELYLGLIRNALVAGIAVDKD